MIRLARLVNGNTWYSAGDGRRWTGSLVDADVFADRESAEPRRRELAVRYRADVQVLEGALESASRSVTLPLGAPVPPCGNTEDETP